MACLAIVYATRAVTLPDPAASGDNFEHADCFTDASSRKQITIYTILARGVWQPSLCHLHDMATLDLFNLHRTFSVIFGATYKLT